MESRSNFDHKFYLFFFRHITGSIICIVFETLTLVSVSWTSMMQASLILSVIHESLVCDSWYHQKQIFYKEIESKLIEHANLMLEKHHFFIMCGDGLLHITRPNLGGRPMGILEISSCFNKMKQFLRNTWPFGNLSYRVKTWRCYTHVYISFICYLD